jgi:chromosome partitioning protein
VAITIAVLSQKGGTGKTTMTRSLADVFTRVGMQTLAVDADPQGNLSDYFDADPAAQPTLGEVLTGRARAVDAIHNGVIPANLGLAEAELVLAGKMGRELTMRNALREAKRRYDAILIDCPPTLGLLTVNALVAATHLLIPIQSSYFALEGTDDLLETIEKVRARPNPALRILGVVITMHDKRTALARDIRAQIQKVFGGKVFKTVITKSVRLEESPAYKESIFTFAPESTGATEYYRLCEEVIDRA